MEFTLYRHIYEQYRACKLLFSACVVKEKDWPVACGLVCLVINSHATT